MKKHDRLYALVVPVADLLARNLQTTLYWIMQFQVAGVSRRCTRHYRKYRWCPVTGLCDPTDCRFSGRPSDMVRTTASRTITTQYFATDAPRNMPKTRCLRRHSKAKRSLKYSLANDSPILRTREKRTASVAEALAKLISLAKQLELKYRHPVGMSGMRWITYDDAQCIRSQITTSSSLASLQHDL